VERDATPMVMLGRGHDDDNNGNNGVRRDGGASDDYNDDNDGTAVDLQAQEDLAPALIRGK